MTIDTSLQSTSALAVDGVRARLGHLYPTADIEALEAALLKIVRDGRARLTGSRDRMRSIDQSTVVLIAYPDHVTSGDRRSLAVLAEAVQRWCGDLISHVHLLPFHPSTSDEGFAVADYSSIDDRYGGWEDLTSFEPFGFAFDAVVNHVSASHPWARALVEDRPEGRRIATADPTVDLSAVVRPRTSALLMPITTTSGHRQDVWCTFSHDQWDLNYRDPETLLAMTEVLVEYIVRGAQILRLDAACFMWKESGTGCIHLPQTHEIIRLWRTLLTAVSSDVVLLTETNVPHAENVSYLAGGDQAHLAYNFSLPPLVLDAFASGQTSGLDLVAEASLPPAPGTGFLNFLASHDGIGLRGAEDLLDTPRIRALVDRATGNGGIVSYRNNGAGKSPYELNTTFLDALGTSPIPTDRDIDRFVAAHAVMLALPGVPAVYAGSLFGARNWMQGVAATGVNRAINRWRFDLTDLARDLDDDTSVTARIYRALTPLLVARRQDSAFDPTALAAVESVSPQVFALRRTTADGHVVDCLHNLSDQPAVLPSLYPTAANRVVFSNRTSHSPRELGPYEVRWVRVD
jgi:sucrose phosphorylase